MTDTTIQIARAGTVRQTALKDYFILLKPRVMSLAVFTALTGMLAAPGHTQPAVAAGALLLIAMGAGAAGALNMWYDADIDALMARTAGRPVPRGRVRGVDALMLGLALACGSVLGLGLLVNWLAAGLMALTIFHYVVVYTAWLKRRTPQSIVIGGAAGALPPMIGWAAATGTIGLDAALMFLVVFIWTPPHFWSLALLRADDFRRAGLPVLPCVAGAAETRRQILAYSLLLAPAGALPAFTGLGGPVYAAVSVAGGAVFVWLAWRVSRDTGERQSGPAVRRLFGFSITYLFLLFAVILGEHTFGLAAY